MFGCGMLEILETEKLVIRKEQQLEIRKEEQLKGLGQRHAVVGGIPPT
mgnify:CR=1 FL=1